MLRLFLLASAFSICAWGKAPASALSAAEYYTRQHDYPQALSLWKELLLAEPDHLNALLRVSELTLLLEGRETLVERILPLLFSKGHRLSSESLLTLRTKFWELQNTFLTDQAQNLFLQGKHRAERGDLVGALGSYQQAAGLEPGQFSILQAKASVEKEQGHWDSYYQTLKQASRSYPFHAATQYALAESHLYFGNAEEAVAVLRDWDGSLDPRGRALQAVALVDSGSASAALVSLRSLANSARDKQVPPVVFFSLAQALSSVSPQESHKWLERFLQATASRTETGWDPYRTSERVADAKRLVSRLP